MNKVFVTADCHFGHKNILIYENRPFLDIEDMDKTLIKNWNNVVSNDDKVFILGDFSFYNFDKTSEIVDKLNGRKTLIMGNHDRAHSISWWKKMDFEAVSKYPILYDEFIIMRHTPPEYFNEATPFFWMYGHIHSTEMYKTITKNTACVCVERWNYTPVDIEKIKELVKLV